MFLPVLCIPSFGLIGHFLRSHVTMYPHNPLEPVGNFLMVGQRGGYTQSDTEPAASRSEQPPIHGFVPRAEMQNPQSAKKLMVRLFTPSESSLNTESSRHTDNLLSHDRFQVPSLCVSLSLRKTKLKARDEDK